MTTISRTLLTLLIAGALALGSAACSSSDGNKCEKTADKLFSLMEAEFGEAMAEFSDEDKAEIEEQKKELIAECNNAVEENAAETNEALDCILAADAFADLEDCPELPGV